MNNAMSPQLQRRSRQQSQDELEQALEVLRRSRMTSNPIYAAAADPFWQGGRYPTYPWGNMPGGPPAMQAQQHQFVPQRNPQDLSAPVPQVDPRGGGLTCPDGYNLVCRPQGNAVFCYCVRVNSPQELQDPWAPSPTPTSSASHGSGGLGQQFAGMGGAQPMTRVAPQGMTRSAPQGATRSAPQGMTRSAPQGMTRSAPQGATRSAPQGMTRSAPMGMTRSPPMGMTRMNPNGPVNLQMMQPMVATSVPGNGGQQDLGTEPDWSNTSGGVPSCAPGRELVCWGGQIKPGLCKCYPIRSQAVARPMPRGPQAGTGQMPQPQLTQPVRTATKPGEIPLPPGFDPTVPGRDPTQLQRPGGSQAGPGSSGAPTMCAAGYRNTGSLPQCVQTVLHRHLFRCPPGYATVKNSFGNWQCAPWNTSVPVEYRRAEQKDGSWYVYDSDPRLGQSQAQAGTGQMPQPRPGPFTTRPGTGPIPGTTTTPQRTTVPAAPSDVHLSCVMDCRAKYRGDDAKMASCIEFCAEVHAGVPRGSRAAQLARSGAQPAAITPGDVQGCINVCRRYPSANQETCMAACLNIREFMKTLGLPFPEPDIAAPRARQFGQTQPRVRRRRRARQPQNLLARLIGR